MALFNFNDDKSRRQINKFRNHQNNTSTANAENLIAYQSKMNRLIDARRLWEVAESIQTS